METAICVLINKHTSKMICWSSPQGRRDGDI